LGDPVYTPPEVAASTGVSIEEARRLWRALGFPPVPDDARVFTAADVEMLRAAHRVVEQGLAPRELLLQMTRVTGQALARIADAQVTAGAQAVSDLESAVTLASTIAPVMEPFLSYVWRRHLLAALVRAGTQTATPGGAAVVVGFADLVGFTAFSQRRDAAEL